MATVGSAPQPVRTNSSSSNPGTTSPPPPQSSNSNLSAHTSPPRHAYSHSHAGLSSSASLPSPAYATGLAGAGAVGGATGPRTANPAFRASVDSGIGRGNWRKGDRPASEIIPQGTTPAYQSAETIDRWFEDLQHYEATLEEMAAASLDANFKEELTAIEQWFRVLSEAERTAALYSLLQSSTQVQMRFFITVLQQMSRQDPISALLSPANPSQASMEAQMEAKLASMGLKSPASPAIRQFARQSLGGNNGPLTSSESYLSPHSAVPQSAAEDAAGAATLAAQRAKLKASSRTSAPANLLLGASAGSSAADKREKEAWRNEQIREGSTSPGPGTERPKSTGSTGSNSHAPPTSAFLRNSTNTNSNGATNDLEGQLSPIQGGSWASMVNTPLVPMFGSQGAGANANTSSKVHDIHEGGTFGGLSSPGLDAASTRLGSWQGSHQSANSIVLDDVRKFRRSARVSGGVGVGGGIGGGALGGMYDENNNSVQNGQRRPSGGNPTGTTSSFASAPQNAINLGLAGLPPNTNNLQQQRNFSSNAAANNGPASPGLINAQQAAVAAQQNWRNGLGSPGLQNPNGPPTGDQYSPFQHAMHTPNTANGSANSQFANLLALQQQMQLQQLSMAAAAGIALTPVQMMGLQHQQQQVAQAAMLSPNARMAFGGMGMGGFPGAMGMPMGMGGVMNGMGNGMGSPRRSPRQNDRSPGGSSKPSSAANPGAGSGSNPDEALDMNLLNDVPAWLRSLRLHKYTTNFETSNWKEMIMLDDKGLEGKGVSALGARRKLLKVFETVRGKMGMALPGDGQLSAADASSNRSVSPGEQDDSSAQDA